jgi:replicative DNA helicase
MAESASIQEMAEVRVIAAVWSYPELYQQAAILDSRSFISRDRWAIFRETLKWAERGGGSQLAIMQELKNQFPDVDWARICIDISTDSSLTPMGLEAEFAGNLSILAGIAGRATGLDLLLEAGKEALSTNYDEASALAAKAAVEFASLNGSGGMRLSTIGAAAQEVFARIIENRPNVGPNVGLDIFDRGYARTIFAPGKLVVLAARPGVGKTALALQLALALSGSYGVAYWSCEMDAEELASRVIVSQSRVKLARLVAAKCDSGELARVREAVGYLTEAAMLFDDTATSNINSTVALARKTEQQFGSCGAVVLDYFQSMSAMERHASLHSSLGEVSRSLKAFARRNKVCVILPTQLNRKIEDRDDGQFRMSDLGECGRLEQDADSIFYLDRPFARNKGGDPRDASLYAAKVRGGVAGVKVHLDFDGEAQTFSSAH